jgi:hypothetical protein
MEKSSSQGLSSALRIPSCRNTKPTGREISLFAPRRFAAGAKAPYPQALKAADDRAAAERALESLKRGDLRMNRHRALDLCLRMIFSENRFTLFRIMR